MTIAIATTRVACNTSTGNQDITTTDLGGVTPKAAYFIVTAATANATATDGAMLGKGAATGTSNQWATAVAEEHAAATMDTYNSESATTCVRIVNPADGTVDGEAAFVSFVADGVRINWTNAPAAAYLLTVVLFAGSALTAHANTVSLGDTLNNAVDVTAPGFRPDIVLADVVDTAFPGSSTYGMVHEDGAGTVTQRAVFEACRTGQASAVNMSSMRADAGAFVYTVGAALDWYAEFGSFDSSGFTVTTRNAGANSANLHYLALDFGGEASAWVGTLTTPTATGSQATTAPGFQPQFVMMFPSLASVAAGIHTDARAHSTGVITIDADEQYSNTISSEDAAANANTQSLSSNVAAALPDHAGALDIEATLTSLDATGWTLNFSNINAQAKLWPALAIGLGSTAITGALAKTLDGATLSASGILPILGAFAKTLDAATLAATGTLPILGVLTKTLDGATLVSAGTLPILGALAKTLDGATLSATGTLPLTSAFAKTLDGATLAATGSLFSGGVFAATLDNVALAATARLAIKGAFVGTLDGATLAATGTVAAAGAFAKSLDGATLVATGALPILGALAKTLDNATLTSTGVLPVQGALAVTLAGATLTAAASFRIFGVADISLAGATLIATGTGDVTGVANITLDDATLVATGTLPINAVLAAILADVTLSAQMGNLRYAYITYNFDTEIAFVVSADVEVL